MMRKIPHFMILFLLTATTLPVLAATPPKAGATCLKLGSTQNYLGKKFTCIKSGKKLVWNKGVAIPVVKPSASPSASPSQSPTPAPSETPSPTPTKTPKIPVAGSSCETFAERIKNSEGFLECRFVKGKKLQFIQLSATPPAYTNPKSAQNVSLCKLKGYHSGNALTGFGIDLTMEGVDNRLTPKINPAVGQNDVLIVPFDFPDLPGESGVVDRILNDRKQFLSWVDYFSSGKLKFKMDYLDHWVRMPNKASFYNQVDYNLTSKGQGELTRIAQLFMDTLTQEVDLTKYRTVFGVFPLGQDVIYVDLVPRSVEFKIKEGTRVMSFFSDPAGYDLQMQTPLWSFWVHELGHDWGLLGHAPGNGWPINIMTNQAGYSLSLNAWERFLLSWMPDDLVYCDTKNTLVKATVKLSALERADNQTKMIAIALDERYLLVIEAHGNGVWSSRRKTQNYGFDENGYYAIMAYVVDAQHSYTGPTQVNPDGSALEIDDGNNPVVKRYAYFSQVDGGVGSSGYGLVNFGQNAKLDYDSFWAVQGDSFTIQGIRIKFVSTGDYETVEIERI